MSLFLAPLHLAQDALRAVDKQLENVSLAADAIQRGRSELPPVTSDFNEKERPSLVSKVVGAVRDQVQRGLPVDSPPVETVRALLDGLAANNNIVEGIDDRKLAFEYAFRFLSRLPPSQLAKESEALAIKTLYRDLAHPPGTFVGPEHGFRTWNGSNNSADTPELGRSFTPYSRSCTSGRAIPPRDLPDPSLVFDMLIRRDKFLPHPGGLSGLFFSFDTTVIHSVFRTRRSNWNINETSSYVDLGILYGNTKHNCERMRIIDGQGKIIPDSFAETRISVLPPAAAAILVMFNRNHNWICEKLLSINERETWKDPSKFTEKDKTKGQLKHPDYSNVLEKQDYEIFQTARLINSFAYATVVLSDFLSAVLGTQLDGSTWTLDITSERREPDRVLLERGKGNSCSIEFNTLYRFHAAMSEDDEKYITGSFNYIFGNTNLDELSPELFELSVGNFGRKVAAQAAGRTPPPDVTIPEYRQKTPAERGELNNDSSPTDYRLSSRVGLVKRDPITGRFPDKDLAEILLRATSVPAAAFKARGVPSVMRVIEILGIEQARSWGACTINEFRRFLGLRPYATFEEWNSDSVIADAARKLYRDPENLELYVGLAAEEPKPADNAAGLCPSFTTARAILADAIALVRGDRHFTFDLTPYNLTSWGITEANRNTDNAAWGGMLGRIFQRGLPDYYPAESIYMHFPLVTPTGQKYSMDNTMQKLGKYEDYTWTMPTKTGDIKIISKPEDISSILSDPSNGFSTVYRPYIDQIGLGKSFLADIDDHIKFDKITQLIQHVFVPREEHSATFLWFHDRTCELMRGKHLEITSGIKKAFAVDLVKDVLRLVPVHWASSQVAGLPLKTSFSPHGIYYEQQMYQMFSEIHTYIFCDSDPSMKIPHRKEAKANVERLSRFVKLALAEAMGGLPASVLDSVAHMIIGSGYNAKNPILKRIADLKAPTDAITADIIAVISMASIELSQILTHVINFYLAPETPALLDPDYDDKLVGQQEKAKLQATIVAVASQVTAESQMLLAGYAREALRLDPVIDGVWRQSKTAKNDPGLQYNKGDKLWLDYRAAGLNPEAFQDPTKVDPQRPQPEKEKYGQLPKQLQGDTVFKVLGEDFVYGVTASVLRAVFSFPSIRRAAGYPGILRRYKDVFIAPPDNLLGAFVKDPKVILGDDGEPVSGDPFPERPAQSEFEPLVREIPEEHMYIYGWKSTRVEDWEVVTTGDEEKRKPINTAWRFQYPDPENAHRLTQWATGLTVNYDP
ncbi:heme peroxidase [Clavulina sp. PMI_390]|nr:heme peroxidase [Clavulina sp. PMI_390]